MGWPMDIDMPYTCPCSDWCRTGDSRCNDLYVCYDVYTNGLASGGMVGLRWHFGQYSEAHIAGPGGSCAYVGCILGSFGRICLERISGFVPRTCDHVVGI